MNYYESDVSKLIRARFGKEKFDFGEMAKDIVEQTGNPVRQKMLIMQSVVQLGLSMKDARVVAENCPSQWLWELLNVRQGVEINVSDVGLIEAMLRTDIEAVMKDVHLPFPICEFVFPTGIPLGDLPFMISGCLIVNFGDGSLFEKTYRPYGVDMVRELPYGYGFFTRLIRKDGNRDKDGVSWVRFAPDQPLDTVPSFIESLSTEDRQATQKLAYLVLGLCLYFQTEEGQKALISSNTSARREGVSPAEGRALKKRKSYTVLDLITHKLAESRSSLGGTHASPKAHWRRLHMRTLRSDRYRRNPNGSVRAIWIMPMRVNAKEGDEEMHSRRKL